jgi:hypothetical protein
LIVGHTGSHSNNKCHDTDSCGVIIHLLSG